VSSLPKVFATFLAQQGLSKGSVRNYVADLSRFIAWFKRKLWPEFSSDKLSSHVFEKYVEFLSNSQIPPSTAKRYIATLKQFSKWAISLKSPAGNSPASGSSAWRSGSKWLRPNIQSLSASDWVTGYAEYLVGQGLSKGSIRNYSADLARFLSWYEGKAKSRLSPANISAELLSMYRTDVLASGVPEATARRYVATLKQLPNG